MEHLECLSIQCKSFLDKDGWRIELVVAGVGGEWEVDYVSKWLHDIIVANSASLDLERGVMQ